MNQTKSITMFNNGLFQIVFTPRTDIEVFSPGMYRFEGVYRVFVYLPDSSPEQCGFRLYFSCKNLARLDDFMRDIDFKKPGIHQVL